MTGAVATHSAATAPRERGWRWFVLALLLVAAATAAPAWPPALALLAAIVRLLLPFEPLALLVLVPLAACAIVGWWSGGRTLVALLTVAVIGWALVRMPVPATGFGSFVRGWALALSAAFGLVCLASGSRPFFGRALSAIALAAAVTALGIGAQNEADGPLAGAVRLMDQDYQRRLDESLADWHGRTQSGVWQAFAVRVPPVAARAEALASQLEQLQNDSQARSGSLMVLLSPALLALESMLALALGWAAYHRLARARIGPPLGALRDLRFNDQLIWGLVVGAVLLMLPTLVEWRVAGLNLLCFFGALYALRGVAVASWWIPDRWALPLLLLFVVLVSLLGPTLTLMALTAICFGVGLSDTWRDFRFKVHAS
ncbi:MAG: DUF2232 domain-containing protein [Gemmatimonadaceae bacterium]